ncbi:hypothetical protein ACB098_05G103500 [Castanea mollissima]
MIIRKLNYTSYIFCLFHACVGLVLPSLAKLRTMYVKVWRFI